MLRLFREIPPTAQGRSGPVDVGPPIQGAALVRFVAGGLALIGAVFGACVLAEALWFAEAPPAVTHYLHLVRGIVTSLFVMVWGTLSVHRHLRDKQALREREQAAAQIAFQASVLEQVRNAVIAVDRDGRIVFWNRFAEELYQWRAEEVLGRIIADVTVFPDDVERARTVLADLVRSGSWEGEWQVRRKDGSPLPVHLVNAVLYDSAGRPAGAVGVAVDITERRRAEQRQAMQFAVTRVLAEATAVAEATPRLLQAICEGLGWDLGELWCVDGDGAVLRWQDFWHGSSLNAEEFVAASRAITFARGIGLPGRVWSSGLPAWINELAEDRNFLRTALTTRAGLRSAFAFPVHNGPDVTGVLAFFSRAARPFDEGLLRTMADIGSQIGQFLERRRAEEALRESRRFIQNVANASPVILYLYDLAGFTPLYVNRGLTTILGYQPEQVRGAEVAVLERLAPPDEHELHRRRLARVATAQDGEIIESEARMQHATGGYRWLNLRETVFTRTAEGAPKLVLGVAQDCTERKQAEEALRDSETRYRLLAEHAQDLISRHTPSGVFLYLSPACRALLGYEAEELIGRQAADLLHPDSFEEGHPWRLAGPALPETKLVSARLRRKDDTFIWVETSLRTLKDPGTGAVREVVCVTRDHTERRRLEDQFRQAQKMEAVGRLAGGVAHDFNNLLSVILCNSDLLLRRLRTDSTERILVEEIKEVGMRGAALLRQLLAVSRKQTSVPQPVDVNGTIAGMRKMLQLLVGEDVELVTHLDPSAGWVRLGPGQLGQVLMNFAVNARDAMPRGGRLTIETTGVQRSAEGPREHLDLPPGAYAEVSVADTGCGMPQEVQAHLFEPFFTTKEERGTGLGLSTVYGIVKQSGGAIDCRSEPGQGTTFRLLLPCVPAGEGQAGLGTADADLPRGTETVLLVEDEDTVRVLARQILQQLGYTVLEASNGAEALLVSEQHAGPIHVLLTDALMPQMHGHDLASRLAHARPDLRILVMSGHAEEAIVRSGGRAGSVAMLHKPLTVAALARSIREVLDAPSPADSRRRFAEPTRR